MSNLFKALEKVSNYFIGIGALIIVSLVIYVIFYTLLKSDLAALLMTLFVVLLIVYFYGKEG